MKAIILMLFLIGTTTQASEGTVFIGDLLEGHTMDVLRALETGKEAYHIIIDSGGGMVLMGTLIMDKISDLQRRGVKVDCTVMGRAHSMAFSIFTVCPVRRATQHSSLMFHQIRVYVANMAMDDLVAFTQRTLDQQKFLDVAHTVSLGVPYESYKKHLVLQTFWTPAELKAWAPKFEMEIIKGG